MKESYVPISLDERGVASLFTVTSAVTIINGWIFRNKAIVLLCTYLKSQTYFFEEFEQSTFAMCIDLFLSTIWLIWFGTGLHAEENELLDSEHLWLEFFLKLLDKNLYAMFLYMIRYLNSS